MSRLPEMVVVPGGSSLIGSPPDEERRDPDEGPPQRITFERSFAVARYPVTRAEFARFVGETRRPVGDSCYAEVNNSGHWGIVPEINWRNAYPQSPRDPAVCVNFDDIRAYAGWLNQRSGGGYRLISQAEHENGQRADRPGASPGASR